MVDEKQDTQDRDLGTSPSRINDPRIRLEVSRAMVWVAVVGTVALAVWIARPLLVIFGAMVFASMIDGGARLLGQFSAGGMLHVDSLAALEAGLPGSV